MRTADVFFRDSLAGKLIESVQNRKYRFIYETGYYGPPVSLTMPIEQQEYEYDVFPPFFDGLLLEGYQLEALLKIKKIDRDDLMSQLIAAGSDTVGAVTIKETS
ncbi:MAG: HipA N-terminal domain-containing protein [Pseudomonadota bacterium]